jgi:hypothetical protein
MCNAAATTSSNIAILQMQQKLTAVDASCCHPVAAAVYLAPSPYIMSHQEMVMKKNQEMTSHFLPYDSLRSQ